MRDAHDVTTVRAAEASLMARVPEGTLMARAAAGLAATCADLLDRVYGSRVAVLVGSGDNGGDALYAAAALARRGARVDALLLSPGRAHAGGLADLRAAGGRVHDVPSHAPAHAQEALVAAADLVLDGIVGIGGRGALRPEAAGLAAAAEEGGAVVVAVDVPSGVDADTGETPGVAVRADVTVTFGTHKPGLFVDPGAERAGAVRLVDIGLGPHLPEPAVVAPQHADVAALLPVPAHESDKYRRGVVGIAAGSARYPGAAVLATGAALRGGAGAVRCSAPQPVLDMVLARHPEVLATPEGPAGAGRVQAWVVGPGVDVGEEGRARLREALDSPVPVLVDADGLTLLAELGPEACARPAPVLLTPHAGEAVRLLAGAGAEATREDVEARRLEYARHLAAAYGASVLLKGSTTVVARPDGGPVAVNATGTPWLATAGSGDVLAGLAGSLLAAGLAAHDAASAAAYLHGLAARIAAGEARSGEAPVTATQVSDALSQAWRQVVTVHW